MNQGRIAPTSPDTDQLQRLPATEPTQRTPNKGPTIAYETTASG